MYCYCGVEEDDENRQIAGPAQFDSLIGQDEGEKREKIVPSIHASVPSATDEQETRKKERKRGKD